MDTRKVQVTGKSTYIVTLPKKWAVDSGLVAGSLVRISYQDDGSIAITPPTHDSDPPAKRLELGGKSMDAIMRDIIGAYVMGHRSIEVHADHIPKETKKRVKSISQNLIGIEVVKETDTVIEINDLLDVGEFTIEKGIKRMSSLVFLMLDGLINYLKIKDDEILREIISRDDEVDRMYLLVSKQFITRLNLGRILKIDELSLIESFYYRLAAGNLERIGDHAVKIADAFSHTGVPDAALGLGESVKVSQNLIANSIESLRKSDASLANDVLSENATTKELLSKLMAATAVTSSPEIVIDSLSRTGDYAANIAELAIDLSQL
ncbi:MAG: phosphate uptake regulator PhoU [Euryarchaeota archaeon]|nr:phosphate uptake regulator PhoU [Euryarchaeota archaeon]